MFLQFPFATAFAGDLVVVAYSTAALVAVVGLDIYFWFLVVAFYKENNQTQQQIWFRFLEDFIFEQRKNIPKKRNSSQKKIHTEDLNIIATLTWS